MSQGKALDLTGIKFPYFTVIRKTDQRQGKKDKECQLMY